MAIQLESGKGLKRTPENRSEPVYRATDSNKRQMPSRASFLSPLLPIYRPPGGWIYNSPSLKIGHLAQGFSRKVFLFPSLPNGFVNGTTSPSAPEPDSPLNEAQSTALPPLSRQEIDFLMPDEELAPSTVYNEAQSTALPQLNGHEMDFLISAEEPAPSPIYAEPPLPPLADSSLAHKKRGIDNDSPLIKKMSELSIGILKKQKTDK